VAIVEALPDHVTSDVPDKLRADLGQHGGFVADDGNQVAGFVVVRRCGARAGGPGGAGAPSRRAGPGGAPTSDR
jgi:hypothetical protein